MNEDNELNPATQLHRLAAQCFFSGIVAHKLEQPENCDRLVALVADGRATPFVIIEPGKAAQCGFRIAGTQECIVFATMPATEPMPDWLN